MGSCPFDKLFAKSVPHIVEKIFLSLDYESYKECINVSRTWNELFTSEHYMKIVKSVFHDSISEDEKKLRRAAREGDAIKVRRLLSIRLLDVNCNHNVLKMTPLQEASRKGHEATVQLLLNAGADPNVEDCWGWTPLCDAAVGGHKDVMKLLLDGGADTKKAD